MTTEWVTWALQLLLAVLVARVWAQLDKNTDAITNMRIDLPTNYVSKPDFDKLETYASKRIHDIAAQVHELELKNAARTP